MHPKNNIKHLKKIGDIKNHAFLTVDLTVDLTVKLPVDLPVDLSVEFCGEA
jgi:hypothetical protein